MLNKAKRAAACLTAAALILCLAASVSATNPVAGAAEPDVKIFDLYSGWTSTENPAACYWAGHTEDLNKPAEVAYLNQNPWNGLCETRSKGEFDNIFYAYVSIDAKNLTRLGAGGAWYFKALGSNEKLPTCEEEIPNDYTKSTNGLIGDLKVYLFPSTRMSGPEGGYEHVRHGSGRVSIIYDPQDSKPYCTGSIIDERNYFMERSFWEVLQDLSH